MKVGDWFVIISDNDTYNKWRGRAWRVTHVSTKSMPAKEFYARGRPRGYHPSYDETMGGEKLYDADGLPVSLYEYEVEQVSSPRKRTQSNKGRHETIKRPGHPTYDPHWSGVSYAPTARGKKCPRCGGHLHNEDGNHYCPYCDDYVRPVQSDNRALDPNFPQRTTMTAFQARQLKMRGRHHPVGRPPQTGISLKKVSMFGRTAYVEAGTQSAGRKGVVPHRDYTVQPGEVCEKCGHTYAQHIQPPNQPARAPCRLCGCEGFSLAYEKRRARQSNGREQMRYTPTIDFAISLRFTMKDGRPSKKSVSTQVKMRQFTPDGMYYFGRDNNQMFMLTHWNEHKPYYMEHIERALKHAFGDIGWQTEGFHRKYTNFTTIVTMWDYQPGRRIIYRFERPFQYSKSDVLGVYRALKKHFAEKDIRVIEPTPSDKQWPGILGAPIRHGVQSNFRGPALRSLTSEEVQRFASRKGVKRIAVENFLWTLEGMTAGDANANLSMDAQSYRWNSATVSAIRDGIRLASK